MNNEFQATPLPMGSLGSDFTPVIVYDPAANTFSNSAVGALAVFLFGTVGAPVHAMPIDIQPESDSAFTPVQLWSDDGSNARQIATIPLPVQPEYWASVPIRSDYGDMLADYDVAEIEADHFMAAKNYGW